MGTSPGDPGYMYLMRWYWEYKIGIARNPKKRLRELGYDFPGITIMHTFRSESMVWAEKRLHARFAHRHLRLEWFALTPDDVEEFCAYQDYQWDIPKNETHEEFMERVRRGY